MSEGTVVVFGGDGFCGWPTSLHLSRAGYEVVIVDNFSRRRIEAELSASSLTPIRSLDERLETWRTLTGRSIRFHQLDVATDFDAVCEVLSDRRGGQAFAHGFLSLRMALRMVTSLRMQATMATFAGFPAARRR